MHISVLLCPAFRKSHSDSLTVESRLSITFLTNTVWFQSAMYLKLKSLSVNLSLVTDCFIVSKIFNTIPGRNFLRWDLIKAALPCSPYKDVLRRKKKKKTFQIVKCAIIRFSNSQQYLTLNTVNVQFSCSVMSNSLRPHGLQHTTLTCPSPTLGAYLNSCPSHRWCHWTISSSVVPFSSSLQSFPAPLPRVFSNESVLCIRWPKYWSFSFSISPSNEYSGMISFRMDGLDLFAVQATLKSLLQHHSSKKSILQCLAFFKVQLSHPYITTGKSIALTRWTFVGKVLSLLFNMLSRFVIAFLPRNKHLNSMAAVTICSDFGAPKNKVSHFFHCFPIYLHEVMRLDAIILAFWMLSFKSTFSLSSFTFKRLFSSSSLSAIRVVSSVYLRLLIFLLAILIPAYASSSPAFLMMYSA